jgi:hypothetical protein
MGLDGSEVEFKAAPQAVVNGVSAFLRSAQAQDLVAPGLVLSTDGHIAAVWQDDAGWYVTAEICDSDSYVFVVSEPPGLIKSGIAKSMELVPLLVDSVRKVGAKT